ncbi:MAG TPA: Pr6Pr family membrane protein [Solirubrobacterales bacterium]|jgi:hypothetical protein|nr:Pr6Pr family membrane protein [Solirubrobacterales bacterium]
MPDSPETSARGRRIAAFHAVLCVVALAGLILGAIDTAGDSDPQSAATRFERFFSYFTILSNIAILAVSALLVKRPLIENRTWNVIRVTALMSIAITGLIYLIVLRPDAHLEGSVEVIGNALRHYVVPPLALIGWMAFGPWPRQSWRDLGWVMLWPLLFGAFTMLHGAITGWYPYDFLDVDQHGYASVAVELLITMLEMAAIAAIVLALNRRWSHSPAEMQRWLSVSRTPVRNKGFATPESRHSSPR